jgi:two-component system response regulator HydG
MSNTLAYSINDIELKEKITTNLSDVIYACSAEKHQRIVLANLPDDGNQYVAEAIHDFSGWSDKPFFALSCQGGKSLRTTLTHPLYCELPDLLTNEMVLDSLRGGTVLLTDPYDLSLQQQQGLLQLLEENLSLKVIINMKSFNRETMLQANYPLLKDAKIVKIPSLRNRPNDIRFAANYFLSKSNIEWSRNINGIADECLDKMLTYPWPGQIPQLRDVIRQAAFLTPSNQSLKICSLPIQIQNFKATERDFLKEAVKQAEYEMIYKTLRETNNNKRKAAAILNISRKTLYSKIKLGAR